MSGEVVINISNTGKTTVEVQGVAGASCKDLTKDLEQALGKVISDTKTPDFYRTEKGSVRTC